MYGRVIGVSVVGVQGHPVAVEVYVGRGLPSLTLTGLPGTTIQDARERIRPAVESAGFRWPKNRIVVNLSPGNMRKEGAGLDLPLALGVLAASSQVPVHSLDRFAVCGELSLRGDLVSTPGVLSVAMAAAQGGLRGVVVPRANAREASLVADLEIVAASTLPEAVGFFRGSWRPPSPRREEVRAPSAGVDLSEVRGQARARRALEVAAAGDHNVLLIGAPGAGKTMLARRMSSILPELSSDEALEVTRLHSVAGILEDGALVNARPFRAPHHSISLAGLLGGGSARLRPGEISLAHHGVLFLDELNEFRRDALEGLRQPLEDGRVVVARAGGSVEYPARSTLVAAANPCPCGYAGDPRMTCDCPGGRIDQYRRKLSGPLLDRIDLRLVVPRLTRGELLDEHPGERSGEVRRRVERAREIQRARYAGSGYSSNGRLPGPTARRAADPDAAARRLLGGAVERMGLTGRGFDRALKVARTIADLEGSRRVSSEHVAEALSYRAEIGGELLRVE